MFEEMNGLVSEFYRSTPGVTEEYEALIKIKVTFTHETVLSVAEGADIDEAIDEYLERLDLDDGELNISHECIGRELVYVRG